MYLKTRQASNNSARPQQPIWLRKKRIQWQHFHSTGTQGHNNQVIKKNVSNDQAGIQQEHMVTTTKWLRKNVSNDQAGIQQEHKATMTTVIKKTSSNEQTGIQQEHKATTTNVIKKKIIQWACRHPTRTQGNTNQSD